MRKQFIVWLSIIWIIGGLYVYTNTIEYKTEALAKSLAVLSGEINNLRLEAFEKETKYNSIFVELSSYQPKAESEAVSQNANDSKPILKQYKCLQEDGKTIKDREYREHDMEYFEWCNAFEDMDWCWIHKETQENCFDMADI